jgi:tetratricopeptide (TPR) repeat protein
MSARLGVVLILILILLAPASARAQNDEGLAKQYYKLGEELYNRADYEGALKQFQKSYEYSKRPALLVTLARCHESLGQHEKAIQLYTEYLESHPESPEVIEARINNLKRLVEKTRPVSKAPAVPAEAAPAPSGATPPPPAAAEAKRGPSRPLRWPGWILVGTGGALLVTGIVLGLRASSIQDELEHANTSGQPFDASKEDRGRTFNKAAIATLVLGGAAAATGALLLVLDWRGSTKERRAWIAPVLAAGEVSLAGGIRF